MKLCRFLFHLTMFIYCLAVSNTLYAQNAATFQNINHLLEQKQYFKARHYYASNQNHFSRKEQLKIGAMLDVAFNRPEAASQKIDALLSQFGNVLPDSIKYRLTDMKKQNAIRLFDYREAADAIQKILDGYRTFLDTREVKEYKNVGHLWQALTGQPPQTMQKKGRSVIQIYRDKANLPNITVVAGTVNGKFIFDTGANLSTVTESTARKYEMNIMKGKRVSVGSITGKKVKARIAVCPKLDIGNTEIRNAVFLVFPDSALYFPQIDFQIHGIIGFPVIEAMQEVQITKSNKMTIPEHLSKAPKSNLALDLFNLVLNVNGNPYIFDSGARATFLYTAYYKKHRNSIEQKFKEKPIHFGGAGGTHTTKGFVIPFIFSSLGKTVRIDSVRLLKKVPFDPETRYYGNIGQDVVQKFDKMILNFDTMFLKFE